MFPRSGTRFDRTVTNRGRGEESFQELETFAVPCTPLNRWLDGKRWRTDLSSERRQQSSWLSFSFIEESSSFIIRTRRITFLKKLVAQVGWRSRGKTTSVLVLKICSARRSEDPRRDICAPFSEETSFIPLDLSLKSFCCWLTYSHAWIMPRFFFEYVDKHGKWIDERIVSALFLLCFKYLSDRSLFASSVKILILYRGTYA